jgi:hypothetical protein
VTGCWLTMTMAGDLLRGLCGMFSFAAFLNLFFVFFHLIIHTITSVMPRYSRVVYRGCVMNLAKARINKQASP